MQYGIPAVQADWEDKLRYASQHPGEHEDWDFAYGEFTHTVDNAKKVLFLDPAKRSEVQQVAMTDTVDRLLRQSLSQGLIAPASSSANCAPSLTSCNAKTPQISYAPVLLENDTPPKTYVHLKGDWREHGAEVQPGTPAILPPLPAGPKSPRACSWRDGWYRPRIRSPRAWP